MDFSDYLVFVDESGDHSLDSIDPSYPMFVLSFCVFRKDVYLDIVSSQVRKLKVETFGHDAVVLHEHDIRKREGAFARLGKDAREKFMDRRTEIMAAADFKVFAVVIDKVKHKRQYTEPAHPYYMAMQFGLERIYNFLKPKGQAGRLTHLICEARGTREDKELELAVRRVCDGGNFHRVNYATELVIVDKKANCEGLQIADLTARPIGLSVLRPTQKNRAMEILEKKFATNAFGEKRGIGLKIFP